MTLDIVESFKDLDTVHAILNNDKSQIIFRVSECTLEALTKKATFIESCLNNIHDPLCIVYHPNVKIYEKLYIRKE